MHRLRKHQLKKDGVYRFVLRCERCGAEEFVTWTSMVLSDEVIQRIWKMSPESYERARKAFLEGPSCDENLTKRVLEE